jgi:hypothetical protein
LKKKDLGNIKAGDFSSTDLYKINDSRRRRRRRRIISAVRLS